MNLVILGAFSTKLAAIAAWVTAILLCALAVGVAAILRQPGQTRRPQVLRQIAMLRCALAPVKINTRRRWNASYRAPPPLTVNRQRCGPDLHRRQ